MNKEGSIREYAVRQCVENLAWTASQEKPETAAIIMDIAFELEYLLDDYEEQNKLANEFTSSIDFPLRE